MCIRDRDETLRFDDLTIDPATREVTLAGRPVTLSALDFDLLLACLLYTSDAADERSSVDLGGRRIIKKKNKKQPVMAPHRNIAPDTSTDRTITASKGIHVVIKERSHVQKIKS